MKLFRTSIFFYSHLYFARSTKTIFLHFCYLVTDDDKDEVRCRWAKSNAGECGGICGGYGLPNAYMFYVRLLSHFYQLNLYVINQI